MNTILKLLQIDVEKYDKMNFEIYMRWCMNLARVKMGNDVSWSETLMQQYMANTKVYNYFKTEHAKCEKEFLELVRMRNEPLEKGEARHLYNECSCEIFHHFPRPLLELARAVRIDNPITAN